MFILLAKENSSGLIKVLHYHNKFLLSHSVVMLWLDQSPEKKAIIFYF